MFCSLLIEQLIDLEKVRTENLKFRTDLRHWVMDGWSVAYCMVGQCHIFTQRPRNDWKIERRDGRCYGLQQLLANSIENFISHEKEKRLVAAYICEIAHTLQSIKIFLTLELSQYSKSGSTFSSSEPVAASSDCHRLGNALSRSVYDLASPTRPSCAGARPQELGHWFCSQNLRLSSGIAFGGDCQMTCTGPSHGAAGARTWTQT